MTQGAEDDRLDRLVDVIVQLASGDLSARLEPSAAGDALDAVTVGINLLAEELELTLEQQVTERTMVLNEARIQLERMALYDELTGLANRTLLDERIQDANARLAAGAAPPCVLVLDLDEFKTINDGLGHGAGDRVLCDVAQRLGTVVRDTDTVARLGGDEFAVLMPDLRESEALRIAERLLKELHSPFAVQDKAVWVGASVGLCFGGPGQSAENLLRDADTAMYAAKAAGRGNIQIFRPEMHVAARHRLSVASELGTAIAEGQLRLHYQPIVELRSGRIIGAEALVRWAHPERGLLPPEEFLPIAEDSGHIIELGRWVVREAVSHLPGWTSTDPNTPFQLHVNLSPVEVRWPGMAEYVRGVLDDTGADPRRLALEISETGLMTGDVGGIEALVTLRSLGVGVEIDDFGTGYSSISYLRRLPIDTVKVDRSLISDISSDPQQVAFVSAILRLIESVGLRCVLEGIETGDQRDRLQQLGGVYGQGYFFSEPVDAQRLTALLKAQNG